MEVGWKIGWAGQQVNVEGLVRQYLSESTAQEPVAYQANTGTMDFLPLQDRV